MMQQKRENGAILLLTLLVVSILFVVIAQFSSSMFLDRALAENHLTDVQARCDLAGSIAVFKSALASGEPASRITFKTASGGVVIDWSDESAKLNVNNILREGGEQATEQLSRLLADLEEHNHNIPIGLAGIITSHLLNRQRPFATIGELLQVEGITDEILFGHAGSEGVADYITVYSDGRLNYENSLPEVFTCMAERLDNLKFAEAVKKLLDNPKSNAPRNVREIVKELKPVVCRESTTFRGIVEIQGARTAKRLELVVRREGDRFMTILYNEMD